VSDETIDVGSQNIAGYRKVTEHELDWVNRIKTGQMVETGYVMKAMKDDDELDLDPRQMAMARTNFELAYYHLVRAIMKPKDPLA
jgi:deoxycytidine triphosphate deaminase